MVEIGNQMCKALTAMPSERSLSSPHRRDLKNNHVFRSHPLFALLPEVERGATRLARLVWRDPIGRISGQAPGPLRPQASAGKSGANASPPSTTSHRQKREGTDVTRLNPTWVATTLGAMAIFLGSAACSAAGALTSPESEKLDLTTGFSRIFYPRTPDSVQPALDPENGRANMTFGVWLVYCRSKEPCGDVEDQMQRVELVGWDVSYFAADESIEASTAVTAVQRVITNAGAIVSDWFLGNGERRYHCEPGAHSGGAHGPDLDRALGTDNELTKDAEESNTTTTSNEKPLSELLMEARALVVNTPANLVAIRKILDATSR